MAKITIVTGTGIVIEQFDTSEWDLDKSMARTVLIGEIFDAIKVADAQDERGTK